LQSSRQQKGAWEKAAKKAKFFILDLIFPVFCLGCNREKFLLCKSCQEKIPIKSTQVCPVCEKAITLDGVLCSQCKSFSDAPLDQLIVSSDYKNQLLSKMIHYFKYRFIAAFAQPLGQIMLLALEKNKFSIPDFIIPVPLHPRRWRWRGFNQSEMLARFISQNLYMGIEIEVLDKIVIRKKHTPPQMTVKNRQKRRENINNAFAINNEPAYDPNLIRGKKILLVDDVCTTGSTLFECARTIQKLKPKKISAIVLARQS
jgi:ComF family protein